MRIGMVSTRFAGLDGVSLEAAKVAAALLSDGHESVWFAGELGPEFQPGREVAAAHFATPENQQLQQACFGPTAGSGDPGTTIEDRASVLADALGEFITDYRPDVLMVQNALAIPMQLPLGIALAQVIADTEIPTVAHHHDFEWERPRFADCAVPEVLEAAFPPTDPNVAHVVINQDARDALRARRGIDAVVLPNVMDFAAAPPPGDGPGYRELAGLDAHDIVLLQPTRIIPRKGIELTIRLAEALGDPSVKVVISHPDDRLDEYWVSLEALADDLGVDLRLAPADHAGHTLADAYAAADLVCFPSFYEGFGNALLEAFYYRKPVFVNRYAVYARDIAPTGVVCVEIDGAVTGPAVAEVGSWLGDPTTVEGAVDQNYEIGCGNFSYQVVRDRLGPLLRGG